MTELQAPQPGEFLLYETEDGRTHVECRFVADTLWLPQAGMAELFQTTKQNIAKHIKAIFAESELRPDAVINYWLTTAADGKNYRVAHYNLDAILAVGYRVRSLRGTQFRRWASERLQEYLVKGFTLDDARLKNPPVAGSAVPDRFDELLERIRDIRASERRMYRGSGKYSPWRRIISQHCPKPLVFQYHVEQAPLCRDGPDRSGDHRQPHQSPAPQRRLDHLGGGRSAQERHHHRQELPHRE